MPAVVGGVFGLGDVYIGKVSPSGWSDLRSHGWFGGGFAPTAVSTVDRIDFSNDTVTSSQKGVLSIVKPRLAATGNSNYGWFGGGGAPALSPSITARVDRIDFANDSSNASPRGSLSLERAQIASTGNSNYGWFGGGLNPGFVALSTVDRIDFSNDSSTASVRGPFGTGIRYRLAATGNSNFGWFGGGLNPSGTISTVERIDFSNDSPTASPRGPLSLARIFLTATGNSNFGWFGGGTIPSLFVATTTVDRIDFSNDSANASPRGPLSAARGYLAATSNTPIG